MSLVRDVRVSMTSFEWFLHLTKKNLIENQTPENPCPDDEALRADCVRRWSTMTAEDKAQFVELEAVDKSRYNFQIRQTLRAKGAGRGGARTRGKRKKPARLPGQPVAPHPAFMHFVRQERHKFDESSGMSYQNVVSHLAAEWRGMSEEEKRPFEMSREAAKVRYEAEMAEFRRRAASSADETLEDIDEAGDNPLANDSSSEFAEDEDAAPSPPLLPPQSPPSAKRRRSKKSKIAKPRSAYQFFMAEAMRKSSSEIGGKKDMTSWRETFKNLSQQWKVVSEEERKKYEGLAERDRERYRLHLAGGESSRAVASRNLSDDFMKDDGDATDAAEIVDVPNVVVEEEVVDNEEKILDPKRPSISVVFTDRPPVTTSAAAASPIPVASSDPAVLGQPSVEIVCESMEPVRLMKKRSAPKKIRGGSPAQVSYSLWYKENKDRIRNEHPEFSAADMRRFCRGEFGRLGPAEKRAFWEKAEIAIAERRGAVEGGEKNSVGTKAKILSTEVGGGDSIFHRGIPNHLLLEEEDDDNLVLVIDEDPEATFESEEIVENENGRNE